MGEGVIPPPPWEEDKKIPPPPWEEEKKSDKRAGRSAFQQQAAKHVADLLHQRAGLEYSQDIKDARNKFAGQMAEGALFAAAAPLTGGASLGVGLATMGAAGFGAGVAREAIKAFGGSTDDESLVGKVDPGKALAISLGVDVLSGVAGEGIGRSIGYVAKTQVPKLLQLSASKAGARAEILEKMSFANHQRLTKEIETSFLAKAGARPVATAAEVHPVDIEVPLKRAYAAIGKIPRALGGFGEEFTSMTPRAAQIVESLEKDMSVAGGGVSSHQPLAALIDAKGSLQQAVWKARRDGSLSWKERRIFGQLAEDLNLVVSKELKSVGPTAEALYKNNSELLKVMDHRDTGINLTEKFIMSSLKRPLIGALGGGAIGAYETRSVKGAAGGAAAGAALSMVPKLSAWMLEQAMNHPEGAAAMKQAIRFAIKGDNSSATMMATRAFGVSGARNALRDVIKDQIDSLSSQQPAAPATP